MNLQFWGMNLKDVSECRCAWNQRLSALIFIARETKKQHSLHIRMLFIANNIRIFLFKKWCYMWRTYNDISHSICLKEDFHEEESSSNIRLLHVIKGYRLSTMKKLKSIHRELDLTVVYNFISRMTDFCETALKVNFQE